MQAQDHPSLSPTHLPKRVTKVSVRTSASDNFSGDKCGPESQSGGASCAPVKQPCVPSSHGATVVGAGAMSSQAVSWAKEGNGLKGGAFGRQWEACAGLGCK